MLQPAGKTAAHTYGGIELTKLRPRAGLQHPPPQHTAVPAPQGAAGQRNCPHPCPPNSPPSTQIPPKPHLHPLHPPCGCQARGGLAPSSPKQAPGCPRAPLAAVQGSEGGGKAARSCLGAEQEASPSEHRLRETDRQTRGGRRRPPPYSTLARAEASPAQSEGGRQIQSAMSSCCCRCRWRTADV